MIKISKYLDKQSKILVKNSSWVLLANIVRTNLFFVRGIFVARSLGVELFGIYATILAFVGCAQELVNLNIGTTIIKIGAKYKSINRIDKLAAIIKASIGVAILTNIFSVVIIAVILKFFYGTFIQYPDMYWLIVIYSIFTGLAFVNFVSTSVLRLYFRFKSNCIITTVNAVTDFIIVISVLMKWPQNLNAFFFALILSKAINSMFCCVFAVIELRSEFSAHYRVKISIIFENWKEIWHFTIANSGSRTILTIINRGDVILLGTLAGASEVAFYTVARRLADVLLRVVDPIATSIYPQLSTLVSEKKYSEVKTMLLKISSIITIPAFIFLVVMYFSNQWLIVTFFGADYSKASMPFLVLSINTVLNAVFFWNRSLIQSLGMVKYRFFIYLFGAVICGPLAYLLIPSLGSFGLAIAMLSCTSIIICAIVYLTNKRINKMTAFL